MGPQRRSTPARSKTPIVTRAASKTPSRVGGPSPSVSPPPSLPSSKPVVVSSPHINFDPVALWKDTDQAGDPCFASEEHTKRVAKQINYPFQPWQHCNPLYFPRVARMYGLNRWSPEAVFSVKNRGPNCVKDGRALKCHKSCLPAFLYSLPDGRECNNAHGRGLPTLLFQWKIDKDGQLNPNACWSCFSNGNSFCGIAGRIVDGKPFGLLPVLREPVPSVSEYPSRDQLFESPKLAAVSVEPSVDSALQNDPFVALPAVPGAPKKTRTASEADFEITMPRPFKLSGSAAVSVPKTLEPSPLSPANREVSYGPTNSTQHLETASAVGAVLSAPKHWRSIVQDLEKRRLASGPEKDPAQPIPVVDTASMAAAAPQLLAPFEQNITSIPSLGPQTPSPLPRTPLARAAATSVPTPRAHIDTAPLSNGILRARQEMNRMVTSIRTAVKIAEEAQRASGDILDETLAASEELKTRVDRERELIEDFREERDRFATKLEVLEDWRHSIEDQLRTKTAEAKQLEDKLKFAESETNTIRRQASAVDDMWQSSIAKLKASEEARADLQTQVDTQRQISRDLEKTAQGLQKRNARLEAALLEASAENSLLEARVSSFEKYMEEKKEYGSQHSSPGDCSSEAKISHQATEGLQPDQHKLQSIQEAQEEQSSSADDVSPVPPVASVELLSQQQGQQVQGQPTLAPSQSSLITGTYLPGGFPGRPEPPAATDGRHGSEQSNV